VETRVRGAVVSYEAFGEGRPIVLLHGWPADHRQMILFYEPLFEPRRGWRRIYPDLPGMGRTPGPDWIADHDGMADWTIEFLDAVVGRGQRVVLVGSSYGGYLALRVVERQALRVDGLLLAAPAIRLDPTTRALPPRRVLRAAEPDVLAEVADDEQAWLGVSVVQTRETLDGFRRGTKLGRQAADEAFLDRIDAGPGHADARAPAEPFDRPTLILAGRQDHLAGYADALGLIESFPRATVAVLDRAGHGVPNEQRALFAALVGDWLDRVEEATPRG
jgi:pimeloyl-ACP methyl ester carboxylesterase